MARYVVQLRQDVERWVSSGLIDRPTAEKLVSDAERRDRRSFGPGAALAMMAALLFGAGVLIFIAANWEAFPRLVRVASLFALIIGGYVGGAFAKLKDYSAIGEALWIVAAAAFGGSLALIGQMYHMSGDESVAILTWCVATALAAVALRSGPLTVAAVAIADVWLSGAFTGGLTGYASYGNPNLFLPIVAVLFGISYWTPSRAARHLILLSLIAYVTWFALEGDSFEAAFMMACVSAGLFAVAHIAPAEVDNIVRINRRLPIHALIGFLVAMMVIQFDQDGEGRFALTAGVTLAGIVVALVLQGHESRGLRWIAYLAFAVELCLIYAITMGTMLGTAGFFIFAAVLLGLLALLIIRLERRMGNRAPQAEGGRA
ncbi:DUF2157 domain-containing protein [Aquamicrobium ahrensii]|uniref:Membrane protein n=1 Tax=Aquamicrobium ahrensii TaxID=469551 RepID=A0ABV2KFY9_9HYPH